MAGAAAADAGTDRGGSGQARIGAAQPGARFRPTDGRWHAGEPWSWYDSPLRRTRPYRGLVVAQLIVGNWDLKPDNNRIYEIHDGDRARRVFVVRDLGASLGLARQHPFFAFIGTPGRQGTKNDLPASSARASSRASATGA